MIVQYFRKQKDYTLYITHLHGSHWVQVMERAFLGKEGFPKKVFCRAAGQWGELPSSPMKAVL